MNQQIDFDRDRSTQRDSRQSIRAGPALIRSEDIYIRNYDRDWSYDLSIEIIDSPVEAILIDRYYLQPEEVKSVVNIVPDGTYEVRASLDDSEEDVLQCRINASPENTVVKWVMGRLVSLRDFERDATAVIKCGPSHTYSLVCGRPKPGLPLDRRPDEGDSHWCFFLVSDRFSIGLLAVVYRRYRTSDRDIPFSRAPYNSSRRVNCWPKPSQSSYSVTVTT